MSHTRIIALSAALTLSHAFGVQAQTSGPAELPPSSYTGSQYVDTEGCVFIRGGIDGTTTWVPRVNRDRTQICDQTPTFAGAVAATTIVPTAITPVARPSPSQPAVGEPMPTVASTLTEPSVAVTPAATPTRAPTVATTPKRQAQTVRSTPPTRIAQAKPRGTRILPAHLVDSRTAARLVRVPEGFEIVWDDGRLNPRRGEQSIEGYVASQSTLTKTVPRREVSRSGSIRVVQPRILSDVPVQVSPVRIEYDADRR